jgi:hypothetical protein
MLWVVFDGLKGGDTGRLQWAEFKVALGHQRGQDLHPTQNGRLSHNPPLEPSARFCIFRVGNFPSACSPRMPSLPTVHV